MEKCDQKAAVRLLSGVVLERSLEDLSKNLLNDSFKAVYLHRVSIIPIVGLKSYIRATTSENEREATNDGCEGCHDDTSRTSKLSIDESRLITMKLSSKEPGDGQLCAGRYITYAQDRKHMLQ